MPDNFILYSELNNLLKNCELCERRCGVDRTKGETGYCGAGTELQVARAALHFWEEPFISGENGSGAVFFSYCSLKCCFCQNYGISRGRAGKVISVSRLADIFFELKESGAHNINLVTPTHYIPQIIMALEAAKGLNLPIIWNTSSYETPEALIQIKRHNAADIFLADAKYYSAELSKRYSDAPDYFKVCLNSLRIMRRITGAYVLDEDGMLQKGLVIRLLLLPGFVNDAKSILKTLYAEFGDSVWFSLMSQYTPCGEVLNGNYSELNRKVTDEEYEELVEYAIELGIENCFIQDGEAAQESFIPEFDNTGV